MDFNFSKYHASGNDFVIIDDRLESFPVKTSFIHHICHRRFGIGADGLILLQNENSLFKMRIFNADGNETRMCGNGLRCLVHFIAEKTGLQKCKIQTLSGVREGEILEKKQVRIELGVPIFYPDIEFHGFTASFIDTGVPHLVFFSNDLDEKRFFSIAKKVRDEKNTNVNFIREEKGVIFMQTLERGIDEPTWGCGTGAVAVCLAVWKRKGFLHSSVGCKSGEVLRVQCLISKNRVVNTFLIGSAKKVFEGKASFE